MPFIGNQPALSYTSFAKQDFTTSATTSYTLDQPVANENEIALFINFVRQEPTTAYSASGTSLTLTSATSASDDMYCVFLGKALQTVNPPAGSVGTSQLASTAVTPAKMDLSQDYTFTGAVSGQNYPAFEAYLSSNQTISHLSNTKLQIDTEILDTDSCYDNATNYRFTPTVAGKYYVYGGVQILNASNELEKARAIIFKNGAEYRRTDNDGGSSGTEEAMNEFVSAIIDFNGSTDYVELYTLIFQDSGTTNAVGASYKPTYFGAYRIGA